MPKKTHAPGYTDKRFEVHEGKDYIVILGPHDTTDAPAARVFGDTTRETRYFAHLFAAAPELLQQAELLEQVLIYEIKICERDRDYEGANLKGFTLHILRTVLAKARGQTAPDLVKKSKRK